MHSFLLPTLAAFGCAICNGVAAVLQKVSADSENRLDALRPSYLLALFADWPYLLGIALDSIGWLLTLYAVRFMPLFFVEAVIASSIAVTAVVDAWFRHKLLSKYGYAAVGLILLGLVLLALAATPERAAPVSPALVWIISVLPLILAVFGYLLARQPWRQVPLLLAALSGVTFGVASVAGRILPSPKPIWHLAASPLLYGLLACGAVGLWLFSVALQKTQATITNAAMTASQFVIPAIVGIGLLGDTVKNGFIGSVIVGAVAIISGLVMLGHRQG